MNVISAFFAQLAGIFINTLKRFTSRKFLITAAGFYQLMELMQYDAAVALALGFIAAEGGADALERIKKANGLNEQIANQFGAFLADPDSANGAGYSSLGDDPDANSDIVSGAAVNRDIPTN